MAKKPKYFNPGYTDDAYEKERDDFFEDHDFPLQQLSLNFCIRFLESLPDDEEKEELDITMGRDSEDYESWGYALYGEVEEMESEGHEVWIWIAWYERMIDCTLHELMDKPLAQIVEALGDNPPEPC